MAYPQWLHGLAWISLGTCFLCGLGMAFDEIRRPQKMWIMNLVWPIAGLYFGPLAIWLYLRTLPHMVRGGAERHAGAAQAQQKPSAPDRTQASVAVLHCGAGCTLGDVLSESLVPALGLGFAGLFGTKLLFDFLLAYGFGVAFQYFTIAPMRGLSLTEGIKAAVRADTISIVAFEVGMFGWMALVYFVLFPAPHLGPSEAVFWFMMQIAMVVGFATSYPANVWLITRGWKEKMPKYAAAGQAGLKATKAA